MSLSTVAICFAPPYSKSTRNQIEDALTSETTQSAISTLLAKLNFCEVPGLGTALGIMQALSDSRDAEQWNRFVDAPKLILKVVAPAWS